MCVIFCVRLRRTQKITQENLHNLKLESTRIEAIIKQLLNDGAIQEFTDQGSTAKQSSNLPVEFLSQIF